MYRQVLSYLEEVIRDQRDPPKSQQRFRRLVKAAVQLLPFPIAQLDGSTYYHRFRALDAFNSAPGRGSLMEALARDFVHPTRALANGILNKQSEETWPEQALPYALAFKPPAGWSLEELTREIALPGTEPR